MNNVKSSKKRGLAEDKIASIGNEITGMKALYDFAAGHRGAMLGYIAVLGVASVIYLASSYLLGMIVEYLIAVERNFEVSRLLFLISAFFGVECAAWLLKWFGSLGMIKTSIRIVKDLRMKMFEKLSRLPLSYYDTQPVGRTITRATSDVSGIETMFSTSLFRIIRSVIEVVAVFVVMLLLSPYLGGLVFLSALPALILNYSMKGTSLKWMREHKGRGAKVNSSVAENLNGLSVIKVFGLEKWSRAKFADLLEHHHDANMTLNNVNTFVRPFTVFFSSLPIGVALYFGGGLVLDGKLEIAVFIAYLRYSEMFLTPIRILSFEVQQIQNSLSSAERVAQLFSEPDENMALGSDGKLTPDIKGEIVFDNVSFSYDEQVKALSNVSFHIPAGSKIGIVGRTGSGKTTAVSLIARLYRHQEGKILIDGVDIGEIRRSYLRRKLGFVSQQVIIFRGTVRDNLKFASETPDSLSDEEILKACISSGFDQVLSKLPGGLDFELREGGMNISAGERQLVNLTRVLLRDPAFIILDEATANTDEATEETIQEATNLSAGGKTRIIIAHRLSTIKDCDFLFVFDKGRLVEVAPPNQLLNDPESFYRSLTRESSALSV